MWDFFKYLENKCFPLAALLVLLPASLFFFIVTSSIILAIKGTTLIPLGILIAGLLYVYYMYYKKFKEQNEENN